MVNIVLLFEEAKKGKDHFGLFSISGELSAETSNDPLSTQTTLTLLHMVPDGLTFWLGFSAFVSHLDSSWQNHRAKHRTIYSRLHKFR